MNISIKQLLLILLYLAIINAYLIFPVEYLPEEKYKIFLNRKPEDETKEEMLQRLYYRILMTQIELGTPKKTFTFLLDSDDDRYFVASSLPPKININEREKEAVYYNFDKSELLNESYSSTYKKGPCEAVDYNTFHYAELCTAKDIALFNQNNQKIEKTFEFRMVRINEDSIPGFLGLLYNYRYTRTKHPNFINELRGQNLIENNYWFFDFKKVSPFNRILEGNLVIGGLPHEIYPERFKKDDYVILHKSKRAHFHGSWKVEFKSIEVDDKDYTYLLSNTACVLNYEMYNIIGSLEFHFRIKENYLEDLLAEQKCFAGKLQQHIHYKKDLTFYYCNKDMKDFLYKNLPNMKFHVEDSDQVFELTKEELFYEKGDYIYLMILFGGIEFNYFSLGQMFTTKYQFVFNTFYKEIGFYKNTERKNMLNYNSLYGMAIIVIPFISLFIGIIIGKKIFGKKGKKKDGEELIEKSEIELKDV